MTVNAPLRHQVFAGNRASGRIECAVVAAQGGTRRARVHEAGSLRVRFPNGERNGALDAVMVNTAGGMAGGDRFDIDVSVGTGARLTATTAAAEKIYRSLGPDTEIGVKLTVGAGGALACCRRRPFFSIRCGCGATSTSISPRTPISSSPKPSYLAARRWVKPSAPAVSSIAGASASTGRS